MKILALTTIALVAPLLSACVVEDRGYAPRPRPVIVHVDQHDHDDGNNYGRARFCPPGQAKKGNC